MTKGVQIKLLHKQANVAANGNTRTGPWLLAYDKRGVNSEERQPCPSLKSVPESRGKPSPPDFKG